MSLKCWVVSVDVWWWVLIHKYIGRQVSIRPTPWFLSQTPLQSLRPGGFLSLLISSDQIQLGVWSGPTLGQNNLSYHQLILWEISKSLEIVVWGYRNSSKHWIDVTCVVSLNLNDEIFSDYQHDIYKSCLDKDFFVVFRTKILSTNNL